ncbi:rhodanese-like domain-containing protein [Arundinibacter roseus]|uniref:Rhodanese-like domain-containing protein n=1 Tax=Arundinibacter roseus TaxID=2070510 RepID=A0A4R4KDC1_9BACT|nr:rhodanese-like domain-containing protein [Arundinibacter roseus]TDB65897.1 rhodanese-like domain-containing protein [Arundinibacter roseus]
MKTYGFFLFILVAFSSCSEAQQIKNLPVAEFKQLLDKTPAKNLIDVRTDGEVAGGVIPGARQIDLYSSDFEQKIASLDKSKPVFLYCAVGARSSSVAQLLSKKGFKQIYNANGGISAWRAAGFKVVPKK